MKLRQLQLLRYGHLSDVVLDFPDTTALHIVHGANEAGKSTALAAIADGLFGFSHKTDRKSTRLNSSHSVLSRMPSSA